MLPGTPGTAHKSPVIMGHRAGKGPFSGPPHNPAMLCPFSKLQALRASREPPLAWKAYNVLMMGIEEASAGSFPGRGLCHMGAEERREEAM